MPPELLESCFLMLHGVQLSDTGSDLFYTLRGGGMVDLKSGHRTFRVHPGLRTLLCQ